MCATCSGTSAIVGAEAARQAVGRRHQRVDGHRPEDPLVDEVDPEFAVRRVVDVEPDAQQTVLGGRPAPAGGSARSSPGVRRSRGRARLRRGRSGIQRNLPRRAGGAITRPVRSAAKSPAAASCRRSERVSKTSTPVMVASVTAGSRPARTTSTSGSSGTSSGELGPGGERSGHLGLLLAGALAGGDDEARDLDGRVEELAVVGPVFVTV